MLLISSWRISGLSYIILPFFIHTASTIQQVVIWGHQLHTHTHSYIHYGFFKAFNALGYKTIWLDNETDLQNYDFKNTLFITEHQVDARIPLHTDCWYAVHNSTDIKYDPIKEAGRYIDLKVYRNLYLSSPTLQEVEPFIWYDLPQATIIMPWATDLLPDEIEKNKQSILKNKALTSRKIHWIGTIGGGAEGNIEELKPFMRACKAHNIAFIQTDPWAKPVSPAENITLIQNSYIAPAICGRIQLEQDYIPCRIFKNISYGHLGVTNSRAVYELFHRKIVYNPNTFALFKDAEKKLQEGNDQELYQLMDFVKKYHTYLNRANHLLALIQLVDDYKTQQKK